MLLTWYVAVAHAWPSAVRSGPQRSCAPLITAIEPLVTWGAVREPLYLEEHVDCSGPDGPPIVPEPPSNLTGLDAVTFVVDALAAADPPRRYSVVPRGGGWLIAPDGATVELEAPLQQELGGTVGSYGAAVASALTAHGCTAAAGLFTTLDSDPSALPVQPPSSTPSTVLDALVAAVPSLDAQPVSFALRVRTGPDPKVPALAPGAHTCSVLVLRPHVFTPEELELLARPMPIATPETAFAAPETIEQDQDAAPSP